MSGSASVGAGVSVEAGRVAARWGRRRLWLYVLPLVLMPVVMLVAAVAIVPSEWFLSRSRVTYLEAMGYGARLRGADCQVLLYGDSTALIGLNARAIAAKTGLSTCNIAETENMTVVNGTLMVDVYLQHNRAPRYMVFLFTPEGMDPEGQRRNPIIHSFEPVTFRLQQPGKLQGLVRLMRYPEDVFGWMEHGLRSAALAPLAKPFPPETKHIRDAALGQLPVPSADLKSCEYQPFAFEPDRPWVEGLRQRYGKNGTVVLVDAMPVPVCDPDLAGLHRKLDGVVDNGIETLPVRDFQVGGRHPNPEGSVVLSEMVAEQIVDRMRGASGGEKR